LNIEDGAKAASDTAYAASWDGVTDVAPSKNAVYDMVQALIPIGSEKIWPTETPPTGWLEENGASLLRADYPELFAVIGTMYGAADSTHFNLPDPRGRTIRIWSHGSTVDPDKAARTAPTATGATISAGDHVGTDQADEFKSHNHAYTSPDVAGTSTIVTGSYFGTANTGLKGGNETRSKNTYRMLIIRAF
jgi:microcystin-dependent protein